MDNGRNGRTWQELRSLRERINKLADRVSEMLPLVRNNRRRLDKVEPMLDAMATADAIAEGVADKLDERKASSESHLRVWGIRFGIAAAIIGALAAFVNLTLRLLG